MKLKQKKIAHAKERGGVNRKEQAGRNKKSKRQDYDIVSLYRLRRGVDIVFCLAACHFWRFTSTKLDR